MPVKMDGDGAQTVLAVVCVIGIIVMSILVGFAIGGVLFNHGC